MILKNENNIKEIEACIDYHMTRRYNYNRRYRPSAYSSEWLEIPCSDDDIESNISYYRRKWKDLVMKGWRVA